MHLDNTTCNCGLLQYSWKLLSTIKCLNRRLLPSKICTFALLLQYCRVNLKHHMAWVGSNYRQCWFYKQYPLCSATGIIHNGHQNYSSIQNVQLSEVVWHYALAFWMPRCVTAFTAWSVRRMEWSKTADNGISLRSLCSYTNYIPVKTTFKISASNPVIYHCLVCSDGHLTVTQMFSKVSF